MKAYSILESERQRIDLELKAVLNQLAVAEQSLNFIKEQEKELSVELTDIKHALNILKPD